MALPQAPGPHTCWVRGASSARAGGPPSTVPPGKAMGFLQAQSKCHCSLKLQSEGIAPLLRDHRMVFILLL